MIPTPDQLASLRADCERRGHAAIASGNISGINELRREWRWINNAIVKTQAGTHEIAGCGQCNATGYVTWTRYRDGVCFKCNGLGWHVDEVITH